MRRGGASIAANPVLIGAATTLVVVVAVFLAYNANNGLPFVPTYALKAEDDSQPVSTGKDGRARSTAAAAPLVMPKAMLPGDQPPAPAQAPAPSTSSDGTSAAQEDLLDYLLGGDS